ncbi:MAG: hypothetical protein RSB91_04195 [Clostridia bacterium]
MNNILTADYFVTPQVVRENSLSTVEIIPRGKHAQFDDTELYTIRFVPMERFNVAYELNRFSANYDFLTIKASEGRLCFSYRFLWEQEWSVVVSGEKNPQKELVFPIYAVADDLYKRTPFRGDLHAHSFRSDGREAPEIVAANYRRAGFDFMAITDHHRWKPSKEAITAYQGVPIQLKLFYGEEVHVPGNYIHIVNFGGKLSVNQLYESNPEACEAEVQALTQQSQGAEGLNERELAYRKWAAEQIRKGGGIAILVHPYWICCHAYNMQTEMTRYLLRTGCFDAFELLGGMSDKENNLQTALYGDLRAEGIHIPIVGSSDSHGTEPPVYFKTVFTVVLAQELTLTGLRDAITNDYSVAIRWESDEVFRVDGTFRMVKYVTFLLENYFPRHDELCIGEGIAMKEYVCGDNAAAEELARRQACVPEYARRFFGRKA